MSRTPATAIVVFVLGIMGAVVTIKEFPEAVGGIAGWFPAALKWLAEAERFRTVVGLASLALGVAGLAIVGWQMWRERQGSNPASAVRCDRLFADIGDAATTERVGVAFRVFNGNAYPVRLTWSKPKPSYASHYLVGHVEVVPSGGFVDLQPLSDGQLKILLPFTGETGLRIKADFEAGAIQTVDLRDFEVVATAGKKSGRVKTPDGFTLTRAERWHAGEVVNLSLGSKR